MARRLLAVTALTLMAIEADGILARMGTDRIHRLVDAVAAGTAYVALGMFAANPAHRHVGFVTSCAHSVLLFDRRPGVDAENNERRIRRPDTTVAVIARRTVTAFALR